MASSPWLTFAVAIAAGAMPTADPTVAATTAPSSVTAAP